MKREREKKRGGDKRENDKKIYARYVGYVTRYLR